MYVMSVRSKICFDYGDDFMNKVKTRCILKRAFPV